MAVHVQEAWADDHALGIDHLIPVLWPVCANFSNLCLINVNVGFEPESSRAIYYMTVLDN